MDTLSGTSTGPPPPPGEQVGSSPVFCVVKFVSCGNIACWMVLSFLDVGCSYLSFEGVLGVQKL